MFICVDFDGTMVNHMYPKTGEAVPGAVEWCKKFINEGAHIILWTMRSEKSEGSIEDAVKFFIDNDIKLFGVNKNFTQHRWTDSPKAYAQAYIDDLAIGCPLIQINGWEKPVVDWETVGPIVMQNIEDNKEWTKDLNKFLKRMGK
jgi:hypothetical protein